MGLPVKELKNVATFGRENFTIYEKVFNVSWGVIERTKEAKPIFVGGGPMSGEPI